jgi:hypothetical protein
MSEPRVKAVKVSSSIGGKIQIVQFQFTSDFHYSVTKEYEVDMTDSEADDFWKERLGELKEELSAPEQERIDELQTLRDELSGASE